MNWERASKAFQIQTLRRRIASALARGDRRLLAYSGYSIHIPATDLSIDQIERYISKYGIRVIRGTSDRIFGVSRLRYSRQVYQFAQHYNKILVGMQY